MYGKLVDAETLVRVMQAAPRVADTPWNEAGMVLRALRKQMVSTNSRRGYHGELFYEAYLMDLRPELPEGLSQKRVGLICRGMGLELARHVNGYKVMWSEGQMTILDKYFRTTGEEEA